jgi:hypothetical protein
MLTQELGFAGHLSAAINLLSEAAGDDATLKYALGLLQEADRVCWLVASEQQQEDLALADKCMICDAPLTEKNVSKWQRDIHAQCYEALSATASRT